MPKNMINAKPRILLASLVAPLAVLLIPAAAALSSIIGDSYGYWGTDPTDDAPIRAAGIILYVLIPLAYPFLFAIMCALGYGLNYKKRLRRKNLFIIWGLATIPMAIRLGWASPYGIKDQLIGLMVFLPLTIICIALGVYCWWYIAGSGNRQKENQA